MQKLIKPLAVTAAFALLLIIFAVGYIQNLKSNISENLLRLHIVGASNSDYDQDLKLSVRNRIIADFGDNFSQCISADDAEATAKHLLSDIEQTARDELLSRGCDVPVSAAIEECHFPTKTYGGIALPGGDYTALNVKIGDASGKNWWCVMYPPLCITNESVVMSDSSAKRLKEVLTDEEYQLISESDTPKVKIKFRIAEILGEIF